MDVQKQTSNLSDMIYINLLVFEDDRMSERYHFLFMCKKGELLKDLILREHSFINECIHNDNLTRFVSNGCCNNGLTEKTPIAVGFFAGEYKRINPLSYHLYKDEEFIRVSFIYDDGESQDEDEEEDEEAET